VLHNGRVIGQSSLQGCLWLGRLTDTNILNISSSEYDVLVHLVPGGHWAVSRAVLSPERSDFSQGYGGHLGVDGVEDALIPDLGF